LITMERKAREARKDKNVFAAFAGFAFKDL
jgi:hypothetical protein